MSPSGKNGTERWRGSCVRVGAQPMVRESWQAWLLGLRVVLMCFGMGGRDIRSCWGLLEQAVEDIK